MLNDATAFGGLFLIVVVVSAYCGDPSIAASAATSPGIALVGAIGALSVGATLSLFSDLVWRGFGPFHGRPRAKAAARFPATLARVEHLIGDADERAVVVTAYEFHQGQDGGVQTWVSRRYAAFAASANALVAIAAGLVTSTVVVTVWTPTRALAAVAFAALALWKLSDGLRQLREADAMEMTWLEEHPPHEPG